jgi:hypothetical protein
MNTNRPVKRSVGPRSLLGWWALGLTLAAVAWSFLWLSDFPLPGLLLPDSPPPISPAIANGVWLEIILATSAVVVGIIALRRGERSWMALSALAVAVIVGGFWLLIALAHALFPDNPVNPVQDSF